MSPFEYTLQEFHSHQSIPGLLDQTSDSQSSPESSSQSLYHPSGADSTSNLDQMPDDKVPQVTYDKISSNEVNEIINPQRRCKGDAQDELDKPIVTFCANRANNEPNKLSNNDSKSAVNDGNALQQKSQPSSAEPKSPATRKSVDAANVKNDFPLSETSNVYLLKNSQPRTPQVDSYDISKIEQARERVKRSFDRSNLLQENHTEYVFPRFDWSELKLGEVLGQGGFGTVLEIKGMEVVESRRKKPKARKMKGHRRVKSEGDPWASKAKAKMFNWSKSKTQANDFSHFLQLHGQENAWVDEQKMNEDKSLQRHPLGNSSLRTNDTNDTNESKSDGVISRTNSTIGVDEESDKQYSKNFSFLAWRNSVAGEEGRDAISPDELAHISSCPTNVIYPKKSTPGKVNGHHRHSSLLSTMSHDSILPSDFTNFHEQNSGHPLHSNNHTHRRRVILYATPKDGVMFTPEDEANCQTIKQDKRFITENAATCDGNARYVIKIITPEIVKDDFRKFLQAAMDMATETYFLSALNHPHILKMRAVGQGDMFSPQYFLVLDRLYDTLEVRIENRWKQTLNKLDHGFFVWNKAKKMKALWEERISVARDLAGALVYLHELGIIYRDIKPENVGFDTRGIVKLFDFGLAKEVHIEDECAGGTYKLTSNTGSLRYMAPEVGNKWPYNFFADSYSFGIMLWEIVALERPFTGFTHTDIRDRVMKWGERPKTKEEWPLPLRELIERAWDSNFRKRPTMKEIEETLEKQIESFRA